ncbi:prefoldin subunit 5 [Natronocella acetinitrilica]|uniref:Prefoldin subunit 5 n=1 Tax=Natronocella acetinitrilica TaxID=414046 RepID=A0AAE3G3T9_9GAMM|nr:hypothetical protein [Natronocella acetinitrilica]MCP1674231.1 prefoldin subunit 5 [Natronocella acetinitrilica]
MTQAPDSSAAQGGIVERINQCNARREQLNQWLIRRQAEREQLEAQREQLAREAMEAFGTSDLNALRELYNGAMQDLGRSLERFEAEIAEAEAAQARIEASYQQHQQQNQRAEQGGQ